jgi:hypothetical protein
MITFNKVEELVSELKKNKISKVVVLVEATGNSGRSAEVCRELGYEPVLLTAGLERKYSKSIRDLKPDVMAVEDNTMYENGCGLLSKSLLVLENQLDLLAVLTPNEAPARVVALLRLGGHVKKTLPEPHYSSKITQRQKIIQPAPKWQIINAENREEIIAAYNKLKDDTGRVIVKQHIGVGKRGVYVCRSERDALNAVCHREVINNYGVPSDDGRLIIEEFIPHSVEMSCDIATFGGHNYLIGSPVYKKSGGNSGIIEISHKVGGWLKQSELKYGQVLVGINKAKEASGMMSKDFNRIDHVELMLDNRTGEWIVTEVNFGRPGGDSLPVVQRAILEIDPIEIGVKVLLNSITPDVLDRVDKASIRVLQGNKIGVIGFFISDISGSVSFNKQKYINYKNLNTNVVLVNIDVEVGDKVLPTTTSYSRYGHYILKADKYDILDEYERVMLKNINFHVE